MTVREFAAITQRVIRRNGFTRFVPVAVFPARREIRALEGIRAGVEHEAAALRWAARFARPEEEYLVAFKIGTFHFKVVRICGRTRDEAIFRAEAA